MQWDNSTFDQPTTLTTPPTHIPGGAGALRANAALATAVRRGQGAQAVPIPQEQSARPQMQRSTDGMQGVRGRVDAADMIDTGGVLPPYSFDTKQPPGSLGSSTVTANSPRGTGLPRYHSSPGAINVPPVLQLGGAARSGLHHLPESEI